MRPSRYSKESLICQNHNEKLYDIVTLPMRFLAPSFHRIMTNHDETATHTESPGSPDLHLLFLIITTLPVAGFPGRTSTRTFGNRRHQLHDNFGMIPQWALLLPVIAGTSQRYPRHPIPTHAKLNPTAATTSSSAPSRPDLLTPSASRP